MQKVFRFNDDDIFDSISSTKFAELLLKSPSDVRTRLSKTFGLTVRLNRNPILTGYDGRKVGFGSFALPEEEIHFVVAPKTNSLRLKTLFQGARETRQLTPCAFR